MKFTSIFYTTRHRHIALAPCRGMRRGRSRSPVYRRPFSITGWRHRLLLSEAAGRRRSVYFNDLVYVCAPAPLQIGVAKGLMNLGPEYLCRMLTSYHSKPRQDLQRPGPGGPAALYPQGAYYFLADIRRSGNTGKDKAMNLLQKTGVACCPRRSLLS